MYSLTEQQFRVCLEALKIAELTEKNDSTFGSVILDLLDKEAN